MSRKRYWTDYPITELGDEPGKPAPIRECHPLRYDGDKYMVVRVGGTETSFKRGYIYHKRGRFSDDPPKLSHNQAMKKFYGPWML